MELLKEFNNLIKYLKKNLKREFLFNQNRILRKVQILISYLLVTSWIMVPVIITINQLMNISQAILILKIINLMLNQKDHFKIILSNNLWIQKKGVKKVEHLVKKLRKKKKALFFKQNNKSDQKVRVSNFKNRKLLRKIKSFLKKNHRLLIIHMKRLYCKNKLKASRNNKLMISEKNLILKVNNHLVN